MNNIFAELTRPILRRPGESHLDNPAPPRKPLPAQAAKSRRYYPPEVNPWGLTGAQCAVIRGIADGKQAKELGMEMGLSHKTIEVQVQRLKEKMGATTSLQAALMWDRFQRELKKPDGLPAGALVFDHLSGEVRLMPVLVFVMGDGEL